LVQLLVFSEARPVIASDRLGCEDAPRSATPRAEFRQANAAFRGIAAFGETGASRPESRKWRRNGLKD